MMPEILADILPTSIQHGSGRQAARASGINSARPTIKTKMPSSRRHFCLQGGSVRGEPPSPAAPHGSRIFGNESVYFSADQLTLARQSQLHHGDLQLFLFHHIIQKICFVTGADIA